ncbi:MAG: hypothetical protein E6Q97_26105 [Desulfurellales bacterium]|nr:MAG: hypothetical protein E6Q97_26105 [Desulfurellales bacterium]
MRSIVAAFMLLVFCAAPAVGFEVVTLPDGKVVLQLTADEVAKLESVLKEYKMLLEKASGRIGELEKENAELRRRLRDLVI